MAFAEISLADLGLRWAPATLATAVDEVVTRAGQRGKDWRDFAELVLLDSFTSDDAVEMFRTSTSSAFAVGSSEELDFLRWLPRRVVMSPRRWPVDLGLGQLPPRRLDDKATRAMLAQVLSWLEERCYFGRELGTACVDVHDDEARSLVEVITSRLDLPSAGSLHELCAKAEAVRLSDIAAVAREYIAVPPGREYHSWNDCGFHPTPGRWSAELGRRVIDDLVSTIAGSSDLGGLLLASRQLGSTVVAPVPVDPLRRTSPAAYAPAEAFLSHGSVLTITRLVTRLAASRQLDALAALLRAYRIHVESTGPTTSPDFLMALEVLADDQSRLQRYEEVYTRALGELSGYGSWTVRYTRPPELRRSPDFATLRDVSKLGAAWARRFRRSVLGGCCALLDELDARGDIAAWQGAQLVAMLGVGGNHGVVGTNGFGKVLVSLAVGGVNLRPGRGDEHTLVVAEQLRCGCHVRRNGLAEQEVIANQIRNPSVEEDGSGMLAGLAVGADLPAEHDLGEQS